MFRYRALYAVGLALASAITQAEKFPEFEGEGLESGRTIWLDNCEGCHAYGIAGAPLAGDPEAWNDRIAKGQETLYVSALEGFFGPMGTMMPPRGGNDSLTDEQVKAAVDYMVRLAQPALQDDTGGNTDDT
ncbi:MAG: c-type cytochrome [Pseudomonadota bacterium]